MRRSAAQGWFGWPGIVALGCRRTFCVCERVALLLRYSVDTPARYLPLPLSVTMNILCSPYLRRLRVSCPRHPLRLSSFTMTKKAKTKSSGFYQPRQPVATSTSLSADGRRQVVSHHVFDFQDVAVADVAPPQDAPAPADADESLADANALLEPEPVEGIRGVSVITKTRAKRYAASVRRSL